MNRNNPADRTIFEGIEETGAMLRRALRQVMEEEVGTDKFAEIPSGVGVIDVGLFVQQTWNWSTEHWFDVVRRAERLVAER
jgi:hypothetical protein